MNKIPNVLKLPSGGKKIRDAVHGDIFIPNKFLTVIDTPEFQRLRRIKQLSVANMVFPSADHTRFSHSIGTFHVMQMMIYHFENLMKEQHIDDVVKFTEKEKDLALLSALLHDVGHGPFSHVFENIYSKKTHEDWTATIIETPESNICKSIEENFETCIPKDVSDLIRKQYCAKKEFTKTIKKLDLLSIISSLISSQLDADRMDYLLRDSAYTGVNLGKIDLERLISSFQLAISENGSYVISIPEKYIQDIEQYLLTRFQMQKAVYHHDFKIQMEQIIHQIIERAKILLNEDKLNFCPESIKSLLKNESLTVSDYVSLDDSLFYLCFTEWIKSEDLILSSLCGCILHRKKASKLPSINDQNPIFEDFKKQFVKLLNSYGYATDMETLKAEPFWIESEKKYYAYNLEKDNIWIRKNNGSIEDITNVSKIITSRDPTPIWETKDQIVFINYNVINALQVDRLQELIGCIHNLVNSYSPRNQIEIEKKYHFSDESVFEKILASLKPIKDNFGYEYNLSNEMEQVDTYYDTEDKNLEKEDCTLRTRKKLDKYEITIKKPIKKKMDTGQSERFEFQKNIDVENLDDHEEFIRLHLEYINNVNLLKRTLTVKNNRQSIDLKKGNISFEMALDRVTYQNDYVVAIDYQLEIELKSDYSHEIKLKMLTDYLESEISDLTVTKTSKYKRGLKKLENISNNDVK